jgi:hypothetical protein
MCYTPTPHRFRTVILVQHMLAWHEPCTLSLCRSRCGLVCVGGGASATACDPDRLPNPKVRHRACDGRRRKLELPSCLLSQRNVMLPLPGPGGRAGDPIIPHGPARSCPYCFCYLAIRWEILPASCLHFCYAMLCYVWEEDERSEYNNGRNKLSCVSLAYTLFSWNQNTLAGMQRVCTTAHL